VARFFRLVREDGIDYEKLAAGVEDGQRVRSLYVMTYLSLACGKNVADACASHDVGAKPGDWDSRHPGAPFKTYRIKAREVDRLMKRRDDLFAGDTEETADRRAEREEFRRGQG
jgi:hypothetical protein